MFITYCSITTIRHALLGQGFPRQNFTNFTFYSNMTVNNSLLVIKFILPV